MKVLAVAHWYSITYNQENCLHEIVNNALTNKSRCGQLQPVKPLLFSPGWVDTLETRVNRVNRAMWILNNKVAIEGLGCWSSGGLPSEVQIDPNQGN
jgi:hypothetical protein